MRCGIIICVLVCLIPPGMPLAPDEFFLDSSQICSAVCANTSNSSSNWSSVVLIEPCPPNMTTLAMGASSLHECVCVAGMYGNYSVGCATCVGSEYCPPDSAAPIVCPEGYVCTTSVATPIPGQWVNGTFEMCPVGFFCSNWGEPPRECGVGMFCEIGAPSPSLCPAGSWCPDSSTPAPLECPAGSFCVPGSSAPAACPVSMYCLAGSSEGVVCDPGYVCPAGSVDQVACAAGEYCEYGSGNSTRCPVDHFCPAFSTMPVECPVGASCPAGSSDFPVQCASGFFGVSPWCERCPWTMESGVGASTCICSRGYFFVFNNESDVNNTVLVDGTCLNTSVFCPQNFFCPRDGVRRRCPADSLSPVGTTSITGCKCNAGGVIFNGSCVNGTVADVSAPAALLSTPAIIGIAAVGGLVVVGGASTLVSSVAAGGVKSVGSVMIKSIFNVLGAEMPEMEMYAEPIPADRLFHHLPEFLRGVRVDHPRKTV